MKYVVAAMRWGYIFIMTALAGVFIAQIFFGITMIESEVASGFLFILLIFMVFFAALKFLLQYTPQHRW